MAYERDQQQEAPINHEVAEITQAVEAEALAKYGEGGIPAVHGEGDVGAGGQTASQLAYAEPEQDKREAELTKKVGILVRDEYNNDFAKAFAHYDHDHDGGIGKDELVALLKDAGVGNAITRGMWAKGILEKLDTTHDMKIQWREFESVFKAKA